MTEKDAIHVTPPAENPLKPESIESESKKDDFEERLAGLPEKYREEILRQYDIPDIKVNLLSVFRYSTWVEIVLMIIGTLASVGAGTPLVAGSSLL